MTTTITAAQAILAQRALKTLGAKPSPNFQAGVAVARLIAQPLVDLEIIAAEVRRRHVDLLDKYAEKDKKGKLVTDEDGRNYVFPTDEAKAEFDAEYAALMAEQVEINFSPLKSAEFERAGLQLSPVEIVPLLPILE